MSNLQLPTLTRLNLAKLYKRDGQTIGYKTTIERIWNDAEAEYNFYVKHHGNVIAQIGADIIWLSNAGWNSKTTADRLRRICRDNDMPFSVGISDYDMVLYRIAHMTHDRIASFSYHDFLFRRTETSWIIER